MTFTTLSLAIECRREYPRWRQVHQILFAMHRDGTQNWVQSACEIVLSAPFINCLSFVHLHNCHPYRSLAVLNVYSKSLGLQKLIFHTLNTVYTHIVWQYHLPSELWENPCRREIDFQVSHTECVSFESLITFYSDEVLMIWKYHLGTVYVTSCTPTRSINDDYGSTTSFDNVIIILY